MMKLRTMIAACAQNFTPISLKYLIVVVFAAAFSALSIQAQSHPWRFAVHGRIAELRTSYAPVVYYLPEHPQRVLVLASGYPWPDGTASDSELDEYVRTVVGRWVAFANQNSVLLIAPEFGNNDFAGFRGLCGSIVSPDVFVNELIDGPASMAVAKLHGHFSLVGHSAGAQFSGRYLLASPDRLDAVILSAPSTYAFPNPNVSWPFGEAPGDPCRTGGTHWNRDTSAHCICAVAPPSSRWLMVAAAVRTYVMVGTRDREQRPWAPGQVGSTRLQRAHAWVKAMTVLANSVGKPSAVQFVSVPNAAHDEAKIVDPATQLLERAWEK